MAHSPTPRRCHPQQQLRRCGSGRAPANGIQVYYPIHGSGEGTPLVLLHGGGSTIEVTYGRILPFFAKHRRVIALDEQNHARSDHRNVHRNVPERFPDSGADVAAILQHLGVQPADVMGFSNGASVAMHVALRHLRLVRKLVLVLAVTALAIAPRLRKARARDEDPSAAGSDPVDGLLAVGPA